MSQDQRPSVEEYFMGIAQAVRKRANCRGRSVGSLIVVDVSSISIQQSHYLEQLRKRSN